VELRASPLWLLLEGLVFEFFNLFPPSALRGIRGFAPYDPALKA